MNSITPSHTVFIDESKLELLLKIDALKINRDLLSKDVDDFLELHRDSLETYQQVFSNPVVKVYMDYDKNPQNYHLVDLSLYGNLPIKAPVKLK